MLSDAKSFWWPDIRKDIKQKVKDSTAHLVTGKNLRYQIPKNQHGKLEKLTEPEQVLQLYFTGKFHNKNLIGQSQVLIAIDRFSKWPTAKVCKTAETREVIIFLTKFSIYKNFQRE